MFGSLGMPELIVILVIALIVFGPKKLPEVGRSLGKAMREFKRTTEDIKGKFEEQINAEEFKDIKSGLNDIKAGIKSVVEMPVEVKALAKEVSGPLMEPPAPARTEAGATGAGEAPAPARTPAQPEADASGATRVAEAGVPAQAETDVAAPTGVETPAAPPSETPAPPTPSDSSDPASQHGEG